MHRERVWVRVAFTLLAVMACWMNNLTDAHFFQTCPEACVCQNRQAHCDALSLRHLPNSLPANLEALLMRNNLVRKINTRHLGRLRSLKHLMLKGNRISFIEPDAFRNARALVSLSLTENRLRKLAPGTFRTLGELKFLSLRKNRLRSIEGLLERLYHLQLLNAANNRIRRLSHKTFRHNWRLVVVDLHGNRIQYIHKHAFRTMPLIKYLVLRDNPLGELQVNFKPNIHLELLDFTNCSLTAVVQGLPYSINDLRLSENSITKVTAKDFRKTRKIRLLVLNSNQIDMIEDNAFSRMTHLYDLYISNNAITKLPSKLPRTMHGIYANTNNLTHIALEPIQGIFSLEYLYMRNNQIRDIEHEALWSLGNLRSLDISGNEIFDLKSMTFRGNKHLQRLDMSRNPVLQLDIDSFLGLDNLHIFQMSSVGSMYDTLHVNPMMFKNFKKLLFLDLSNSSQVAHRLANNPHSLDHMSSVQDLNLMEDNLLGLPEDFPRHFANLRLIKLIGNPWHCDMNILWLSYWMRNRTVEFFAPYHMVCASPPDLRGHLIIELTESDLIPVTRNKPYIKYIEVSMNEYIDTNHSDGTTLNITRTPHQYSTNFTMRHYTPHSNLHVNVKPLNESHITKSYKHRFFNPQGIDDEGNLISRYITPTRNAKTLIQNFKTLAPVFFNNYKKTQNDNNEAQVVFKKDRTSKTRSSTKTIRDVIKKKGNRASRRNGTHPADNYDDTSSGDHD